MRRATRRAKKQPIARHRITRTPREKLALALWTALCASLVGVFVFMTWYMYNPRSRLAHNLKYGQRYLAASDYSKATAEFRRVLAMDAHNAEAYQGLMEVAIRSEDTDTALTLYARAEETLSVYKEPLLSLLELRAVGRLEQGDYDGAFSVAVTVEAATGDRNEASYIRALVIDGMLDDARKKEDTEEAIALYRRILTVDNVDAAAVYELMARRYIEQGDEETALAILDEGIAATGGAEALVALRDEYTTQNAEVFLPDSFIRELNGAMAAGDFAAAAAIVRHELFLYRIDAYGQEIDDRGERTFDFAEIQPADMNTTVYEEYDIDGQLLMVIVDWERTTAREAVFHELVYVPVRDEVLSLSQRQRVTESDTLTDEGAYYRVVDGALQEITEDDYFGDLSAVFAGEYGGIAPDAIGAAVDDSGGGGVPGELVIEEDAAEGAVRTGGVA